MSGSPARFLRVEFAAFLAGSSSSGSTSSLNTSSTMPAAVAWVILISNIPWQAPNQSQLSQGWRHGDSLDALHQARPQKDIEQSINQSSCSINPVASRRISQTLVQAVWAYLRCKHPSYLRIQHTGNAPQNCRQGQLRFNDTEQLEGRCVGHKVLKSGTAKALQ